MPRKVRTIQQSLNGGQVDTLMLGRSDTTGYATGMAEAKNYQPYVHGGATTRMGSERLATLSGKSRLIDFGFNKTQLYQFALQDTQVEIFDTAGTLLQTITSAPWTDALLFPENELGWSQGGDTTFIAHNTFETKLLKRTGATTFTLSDMVYENDTNARPYYKYVPDEDVIGFSGTSGSVTATADTAVFVDDHIGTHLRILDGTDVRFAEITAVGSTTPQTTCTVTLDSTYSVIGPFVEWKEYAFSAVRGYPNEVELHSNRLWLASSTNHLFGSRVGRFFSFDPDDATADDAIDDVVGSGEIHNIQHLLGGDFLYVFTDKAAFYVPESATRPITPESFQTKFQAPYGARSAHPLVFDEGVLYATYTGRVVRDLLFSEVYSKHSSDAVSLLATDVLGDIAEMSAIRAVKDRPEQYCLAVNEDGTAALYHGIRSQKISAWYPWVTDGSFISVRALEDFYYACCERTIDGSTVYFLERFDQDYQLDGATKLTNGTPQSTWTGLTDYADQEVTVLTNNLYLGEFTVDATGGLDIMPFSVEDIEVGFDFETKLKTLPPEIALPEGTMVGEVIRVARLTVRLHETFGFSVEDNILYIRDVDDDLSLEPDPKTGIFTIPLLGWSRTGQIEVERKTPLRHTILLMIKEVLV